MWQVGGILACVILNAFADEEWNAGILYNKITDLSLIEILTKVILVDQAIYIDFYAPFEAIVVI